MNLNRNLTRSLAKSTGSDLEGSHRATSDNLRHSSSLDRPPQASFAAAALSEDALIDEDAQADLYPNLPPLPKRPSSSYLHNRQKVRQIAEARLTRLADQLLQLADEIRYYDPLVAEAIDDAWDAAEAALELINNEA